MKKLLMVGLIVAMSALSFAKRGGENDFYTLYGEAYGAVETPSMHKELGMKEGNKEIVKSIINKGWYEIKVLEGDKLKEVFAIDKLMIDGPGNKDAIDKHFENIREIQKKQENVYNGTEKELKKYMDVDKLK